MTLYAAGPLLTAPENVPSWPRAVAESCRCYLLRAHAEVPALVVDETLLGSGKRALAITNQRVVRFDEERVEFEIALADVHSIRLVGYDELIFTDCRGASVPLRLQRVSDSEAVIILRELGARIKTFSDPSVDAPTWQCGRCGPGEVIYLARVHAGGAKGGFLATQTTVGELEEYYFGAYICRVCGRSELVLEDAHKLPIDRIAVARLLTPPAGPYR